METKSKRLVSFVKSYNSVLILLLLVVLSGFFVEGMIGNFATVLQEASIYGFIAVGLGVVMITGNIDLSVGFQAATCAVITVVMMNLTGGNMLLVVLSAVVVGVLMGLLNGCAVVKLGISPLIATIATNYIYKGIVYYFTKDGSYYPEGELRGKLQDVLAKNQIFDLKALTVTVIILIVVMALLYLIMRSTKFGVSLYISGDNAEAGQLAGINISRVNMMAYIICGICCGLAGVFLASKSGAAIYTQGEGRDVFAISACVIGGIKMAGGKGTMVNILLGILIMRVISTAMNQMLIPAAWVDFVSGALLIVILIIDKVTAVKKDD